MNQALTISFYSPIHIGTGEELEPFEYIIDKDNVLYTFSFHRFVASLSQDDKKALLNIQQNEAESSYTALRRFIRQRYDKKEFLNRIRVSPQVNKIYSDRFDSIENLLQVAPFIKTMNTPYIPGSSLKGAIRTAVLNYWADTFEDRIDWKTWEEDIIKTTSFRDNRKKKDVKKDVFKYLKIPDIPMGADSTWYTNIASFSLKEDKLESTDFLMIKEVACSRFLKYEGFDSEHPEFDFTLTIDEKMMKGGKSTTYEKKNKDRRFESKGRDDLIFDTLWKSLDFYDEILEKEKEKWPRYDENLKHFYESFGTHISELRRESDIKIIKLGFGSGFEAVTIKRLRDTRKKYGKSIKMVEGKCPFGWAILRKR